MSMGDGRFYIGPMALQFRYISEAVLATLPEQMSANTYLAL